MKNGLEALALTKSYKFEVFGTRACPEVEILAALRADAFAIGAAHAVAVELKIDGFEQDIVEIDDIALIGDGIEILFGEDDFFDASDARGLKQLEVDIGGEISHKTPATTVTAQLQRDLYGCPQGDELSVVEKMRIVRQRAQGTTSVERVKIRLDALG